MRSLKYLGLQYLGSGVDMMDSLEWLSLFLLYADVWTGAWEKDANICDRCNALHHAVPATILSLLCIQHHSRPGWSRWCHWFPIFSPAPSIPKLLVIVFTRTVTAYVTGRCLLVGRKGLCVQLWPSGILWEGVIQSWWLCLCHAAASARQPGLLIHSPIQPTLIDLPSHWLTLSLTYYLIDLLSRWLTLSLTYSLVDLLSRWLTLSLTYSLVALLSRWLTLSLTYSLVDLLSHWLTLSLTYSLIDLLSHYKHCIFDEETYTVHLTKQL